MEKITIPNFGEVDAEKIGTILNRLCCLREYYCDIDYKQIQLSELITKPELCAGTTMFEFYPDLLIGTKTEFEKVLHSISVEINNEIDNLQKLVPENHE